MISIVDHQDAKIKSVDALRHVISKCSENIDLFIKVSFGTSDRTILTPQVKHEIPFSSITHYSISNLTSIHILDFATIHYGKRWK